MTDPTPDAQADLFQCRPKPDRVFDTDNEWSSAPDRPRRPRYDFTGTTIHCDDDVPMTNGVYDDDDWSDGL